MALFNLLRAPLFILPMLVSVGVAATASLGRVKEFLVAREIKSIDMQQEMREKQINNIDLARLRSAPKELRNGAEVEVNLYTWMCLCRLESFTTFRSVLALLRGILIVKHLCFTTLILLFLKVLNGLTIANALLAFVGKLSMIVGRVGSGKSSLLGALLGEMHSLSGSVEWSEK